MALYNSTQELIGNTPLVKLANYGFPDGLNAYAKLELYNPSGSVKDRIGVSLIEKAERDGRLKPGGTIVAPTAGNTGLGIAFAALPKGYRVIFTIPDKFSAEKQALVRALGAEIVNTSRAGGMVETRAKAEEIRESIPGAITLEQFTDQANPEAHYLGTGPEIYRDLDGKIDYFVAGAGSGGTFSGVARYLKERIPGLVAVLADPVGSIIGGGNEHADYEIEGIGGEFIADTMDVSLIDEVVKITDGDAFPAARALARKEGIFAGSSSGAAVAAAKIFAERSGAKGNLVVVLPDRGDRYFSKNLYPN
ncbi:MAG: cysteine synthase family protein [Clostridiales Family XIII bacterium]|jgi:cysteine synthase A|nr:cysteine synthase family protein [Clostridiales Family XIII bacterium]